MHLWREYMSRIRVRETSSPRGDSSLPKEPLPGDDCLVRLTLLAVHHTDVCRQIYPSRERREVHTNVCCASIRGAARTHFLHLSYCFFGHFPSTLLPDNGNQLDPTAMDIVDYCNGDGYVMLDRGTDLTADVPFNSLWETEMNEGHLSQAPAYQQLAVLDDSRISLGGSPQDTPQSIMSTPQMVAEPCGIRDRGALCPVPTSVPMGCPMLIPSRYVCSAQSPGVHELTIHLKVQPGTGLDLEIAPLTNDQVIQRVLPRGTASHMSGSAVNTGS